MASTDPSQKLTSSADARVPGSHTKHRLTCQWGNRSFGCAGVFCHPEDKLASQTTPATLGLSSKFGRRGSCQHRMQGPGACPNMGPRLEHFGWRAAPMRWPRPVNLGHHATWPKRCACVLLSAQCFTAARCCCRCCWGSGQRPKCLPTKQNQLHHCAAVVTQPKSSCGTFEEMLGRSPLRTPEHSGLKSFKKNTKRNHHPRNSSRPTRGTAKSRPS